MILCVLLEGVREDDEPIIEALLAAAPRVTLEPERAWLDVRGLAVPRCTPACGSGCE
jgi:hypothetical protein